MDKVDLQVRTKQFALRVLKLIESLPRTASGRIVANQLGRAGTAVGANYRACCKARSRAEFIAKIGIVEEEADESSFWLELIIEAKMLRETLVRPLLNEALQLTRIMGSSRVTATRGKSRTGSSIGQSAMGNGK